jgi:peptidoglycan hydrolase CwlO-like protein
MEKVNLPKVDPKLRARLHKYKADHNLECPDDKIRSLEEFIERLIEDSQALKYCRTQNASLQLELKELKKKIKELEEEIENDNTFIRGNC